MTDNSKSDQRLLYSPSTAVAPLGEDKFQDSLNSTNLGRRAGRYSATLDEHHFSSENYDLHSPQRIAHSTFTELQLRRVREEEEQLRQQHQYNPQLAHSVGGSITSADFGAQVHTPTPSASSPSSQARMQKFQRGLLYGDATPQNANRQASGTINWGQLGESADEAAGGDPAQWLHYQTSPAQSDAFGLENPSFLKGMDGRGENAASSFLLNDQRTPSSRRGLMGTPSYKSPVLLQKLGLKDPIGSGSPSSRSSNRIDAALLGAGSGENVGKGSSGSDSKGFSPQLSSVVQNYVMQQQSG